MVTRGCQGHPLFDLGISTTSVLKLDQDGGETYIVMNMESISFGFVREAVQKNFAHWQFSNLHLF